MPVNKNHKFLAESLNSTLSLDYPNIEILVIDNSEMGLKLPAPKKHLKVHKVPFNYGLSNSMNYGIKKAKGKYIFVMHSDDITVPHRVIRQVEYLENHPDVDILGAGIEIIGEGQDPNVKIGDLLDRTSSNDRVKEFLMYKNPLFHPTVAIRTSSLKRMKSLYKSKYDCVEDLEFWMRASRKLQIANIPDVLIKYRIHHNQLGRISGYRSQVLSCVVRIRHNSWLVIHDSNLRSKAIRALARNLIQLSQVLPKFIFQFLNTT